MFHFLYKTTNTLNGKIYIGAHSTQDLNDGYLGSGKQILYAIKKNGRHVFMREILETFETREQAFLRESEIVTEEFIKSDMNYNMCPGGLGSSIKTEDFKNKVSEKLKGRTFSQETKDKISKNNGMKKSWTKKPSTKPPVLFGKDNGMYGKKHTTETLLLMSDARKKVQIEYTEELRKSYGWSQGLKWYNNGITSKRFIEGTQPPEYKMGRKVKALK